MRRPADFQRVFARRRSATTGALTLCGCENHRAEPRLGLSVAKRVVPQAVQRNRWKRLLREAFRQTRASWPAGMDWVAIPRQATPPSLVELQSLLLQLTTRVMRQLPRPPASKLSSRPRQS